MADEPNSTPLDELELTQEYFEMALMAQVEQINEFARQGQVGTPIDYAENLTKLAHALKVARDLVAEERGSPRGVATIDARKSTALRNEAAAAVASSTDQFPPRGR